MLELRGASHDAAFERTFEGPLSASLRARDPHHTGSTVWVKYNEPFYERRVAVPLAGAAVYPLAGERSLLDLSLAGYVASILALFGLLCLRFRLPTATTVALGAVLLPPLASHSSYPADGQLGSDSGDPRLRLRRSSPLIEGSAGCRSGSGRSRYWPSRATAPGFPSSGSDGARFAIAREHRPCFRRAASRLPCLRLVLFKVPVRSSACATRQQQLGSVVRVLVVHRAPLPVVRSKSSFDRTWASSAAASGTRLSSSWAV